MAKTGTAIMFKILEIIVSPPSKQRLPVGLRDTARTSFTGATGASNMAKSYTVILSPVDYALLFYE